MKDISEINDFNLLESVFQKANIESANVLSNGPVGGCGRVYIDLGKIRSNSKLAKLINKHFKFISRPHYSYKCIYVGYDNATGKEWAKGLKIQSILNENGISAILDGDSD